MNIKNKPLGPNCQGVNFVKDSFKVSMPTDNVMDFLNEIEQSRIQLAENFQKLKDDLEGTYYPNILKALETVVNDQFLILDTKLPEIRSSIELLNGSLTNTNNRLGNVSSAVDDHGTSIETLGGRVTTLESSRETNEAAISGLNSTTTGLVTRVNTNKTSIDGLKSKVDAFLDAEGIKNETLDTLKEIQDYIESNSTAAAELVSKVNINEQEIDNLENRIITLEGFGEVVDELSSTTTGLVSRVNVNEQGIDKLEDRIITLENSGGSGGSGGSDVHIFRSEGRIIYNPEDPEAQAQNIVYANNGILPKVNDVVIDSETRNFYYIDEIHEIYDEDGCVRFSPRSLASMRLDYIQPWWPGDKGQFLQSNGDGLSPDWVDLPTTGGSSGSSNSSSALSWTVRHNGTSSIVELDDGDGDDCLFIVVAEKNGYYTDFIVSSAAVKVGNAIWEDSGEYVHTVCYRETNNGDLVLLVKYGPNIPLTFEIYVDDDSGYEGFIKQIYSMPLPYRGPFFGE